MKYLVTLLYISGASLAIVFFYWYFVKIKDGSPVVACRVHMRNLGAMTLQYLGDHDGKFPPPPTDPKQISFSWERYIRAYYRSNWLPFCPSDPNINLSVHSSYEFNPTLYGRSVKEFQSFNEVWLYRERDAFHRTEYWRRGMPYAGPEIVYWNPKTDDIYTKTDKWARKRIQIEAIRG